jgi:hypothetical protein
MPHLPKGGSNETIVAVIRPRAFVRRLRWRADRTDKSSAAIVNRDTDAHTNTYSHADAMADAGTER